LFIAQSPTRTCAFRKETKKILGLKSCERSLEIERAHYISELAFGERRVKFYGLAVVAAGGAKF
jgi:hypothetical protein